MSTRQPRLPAGTPEGGRFATAVCPSTLRLLEETAREWTDPEHPQRTVLRVERCEHGRFARYAASNCCRR